MQTTIHYYLVKLISLKKLDMKKLIIFEIIKMKLMTTISFKVYLR